MAAIGTRLPGSLRSPALWLLVAACAAEFFVFDHFGARRHTPVFPRWHDQIQYLTESYSGYEFARTRGTIAGLLNALTNASGQGVLHDFFALVTFLPAGPSRSAALSVNMLALIGWQVALYFGVSRTAQSRALGLATALLPLALVGPWQDIPGSAYDFRLDHLAMCALGITAAVGLLTDGIRSRRGARWFGICVGVTILTRFLTAAYFVILFGLLAAWIAAGTDRRLRSWNLLRSALLAAVIAVPFLWINFESVRDYFSATHYFGAGSALHSESMGVGHSLRFVLTELARRHLGVVIGVIVAAGALILALLRGSPPRPGRNDAVVLGVLFTASPLLVLTLHDQKSEVLTGALVPGMITLAVGLWNAAARRASERAVWFWTLACATTIVALFTRSQLRPAYPPGIQADIRQVNTIADRLYLRAQGAELAEPRLAIDHRTEALDGPALRILVYERKHAWLTFSMTLPAGGDLTERQIMERLRDSDFVFVTEEGPEPTSPAERQLAALRPTIRAWCEANLRTAERFTLFGRRMVLYQRREIPFP